MLVGGPLVEIGRSVARKTILAEFTPQSEKIVLKVTYEIRLRHLPDVWLQEDTIEKARD